MHARSHDSPRPQKETKSGGGSGVILPCTIKQLIMSVPGGDIVMIDNTDVRHIRLVARITSMIDEAHMTTIGVTDGTAELILHHYPESTPSWAQTRATLK